MAELVSNIRCADMGKLRLVLAAGFLLSATWFLSWLLHDYAGFSSDLHFPSADLLVDVLCCA